MYTYSKVSITEDQSYVWMTEMSSSASLVTVVYRFQNCTLADHEDNHRQPLASVISLHF